MTRHKKPSRSKTSTTRTKKHRKSTNEQARRHGSFERDDLAPLKALQHLPADVRQMLLNSILGEDAPYVLDDVLVVDECRDPETSRLLDYAEEARTPKARRQRLEKVVEYDPDCIEGWRMLADAQDRPEDAIPLHERAVEAVRRSASVSDEEAAYDPWQVRQFVGTLIDLLDAQRGANRIDDAIATGQQILRIEPGDGNGIRYQLLSLCLEAQRHDDAGELLAAYPDEVSADWALGRLLLAVQTQQPDSRRRKLLKAAHRENEYLLDYLLGRIPLPMQLPPLVEPGGPSEAMHAVAGTRRAWLSTPGAMAWLRKESSDAGLLKRHVDAEEFYPRKTHAESVQLENLPEHPEAKWLVGVHELRGMKSLSTGRKKKHWALYAFAPSGPLGLDIREQRPNAHDLWDWLVGLMQHGESPGRPETLEFTQKGICRQLRLRAIFTGIELRECENPPPLDEMFERLVQQHNFDETATSAAEQIPTLPQDATDVWECDMRRLDQRMYDAHGELQRGTSVLVASARDDLILNHNLITKEPDEQTLVNALVQAMLLPAAGPPRRPGEVRVRTDDERLLLAESLAAWNVNVVTSSRLAVLGRMRAEIGGILTERSSGALADVAEILPDDRAAFYEAACRFYRNRPWTRWLDDEVIRVECPAVQEEPIFALVMGQSGIETGLSLFQDRRVLERICRGDGVGQVSRIAGFSLNFAEEHELPPPDYDAIEQFGWPIATPEAYPVPIRIAPGPAFATPTRDELLMLTALMEAVCQLSPGSSEPAVNRQDNVEVRCCYDGRAG